MRKGHLYVFCLMFYFACGQKDGKSSSIQSTEDKIEFVGYHYKKPAFKNVTKRILTSFDGEKLIELFKYDEDIVFFKDNFYVSENNVGKYFYNVYGKSNPIDLKLNHAIYNIHYNPSDENLYFNVYSDDEIRLLNLSTFEISNTNLLGNLKHISKNHFYVTRESEKDVVYASVNLITVKLNGEEELILQDLSGEELFVSPNEDFVIDKILRNGKFRLFNINLDDKSETQIKEERYYYSYQKNKIVYY